MFSLNSLMALRPVYGWSWNTDMYDQPSLKMQERPQNPPSRSVPTDGQERPLDRLKDSEKLSNPVAATEHSLQNGRRLFGAHCAPCHGAKGAGDGPVAPKFIPVSPLPVLTAVRSDGYLYLTIRHGGAVMSGYGSSLSPGERWDLVNFLRALESAK